MSAECKTSYCLQADFFPILDGGRLKPIILVNIETLVHAGIERIFVIVQAEDLPTFERLFKTPMRPENLSKLSTDDEVVRFT